MVHRFNNLRGVLKMFSKKNLKIAVTSILFFSSQIFLTNQLSAKSYDNQDSERKVSLMERDAKNNWEQWNIVVKNINKLTCLEKVIELKRIDKTKIYKCV